MEDELGEDLQGSPELIAGIEERIRIPLAELVEKFAILAEELLPVEHRLLAEQALETSQAILGSMDDWIDQNSVAAQVAREVEPEIRRVLVVEMDRVESRVLAGHLSVDGFQAEFAADGKQALSCLAAGDFDAAIVSSQLGGSGVAALLEAIRGGGAGAQHADLRVFLLGIEEAELNEACSNLDVQGSILRPIELGSLGQSLRSAA